MDAITPETSIDLAFEEIAFTLDGHQYRNIISLLDIYHFYLRRNQVCLTISQKMFPLM